MEIYIIRHGETKCNAEKIFQGWMDEPLNDYGILLARETGKGLNKIHFDAAFSSPLTRAKQTCEIVLQETENSCPIVFDDRIKEINMGDYEGIKLGSHTLSPEEEREFGLFFSDPLHCKLYPNGETIQDVIVRTQAFLKEAAALNYGRILVASHGCAIRCMLNCLYDDPNNFWHNKVPLNCCINIVEVKDGSMKLTGDDVLFYDESLLIDRFPMPKNNG